MPKQPVGGIATILERRFAFPTEKGIGLIELDGRLTLVEFSCPLESDPPKGNGYVIASTRATLQLRAGRLCYGDKTVVFGTEVE